MRSIQRLTGLVALVAATTSCGDVIRQGRSPAYLVVDSLAGIRGGPTSGPASNPLISDVITNVTSPLPCAPASPCPTVFGDSGQATMHIVLKAQSPGIGPADINSITIDRYHVDYTRADGRNTPGVDVPFGFDGGMTITISGASTSFGFELVRNVSKQETPLVQLKTSSSIITMLAKVTFYGHDQAGNAVTASGTIQIDFGNFGDA